MNNIDIAIEYLKHFNLEMHRTEEDKDTLFYFDKFCNTTKEALEKQVPKKIDRYDGFYPLCPTCESIIPMLHHQEHCQCCGQKIGRR